jgi:hypothetical protein
MVSKVVRDMTVAESAARRETVCSGDAHRVAAEMTTAEAAAEMTTAEAANMSAAEAAANMSAAEAAAMTAAASAMTAATTAATRKGGAATGRYSEHQGCGNYKNFTAHQSFS